MNERSDEEQQLLECLAEMDDKVLIGTVRGDLHDIGKNIACFMLDSTGPLPEEARVENVRAMFSAARKYAG